MSLNDFLKQRPFEPDPEVLELLRDWPTPDFNQDRIKRTTSTNALLKKPPQPGQRLQVRPPEPEEIKPLTAEDIEAIRQAAYDEGLTQGKEEGFSQGYGEGREQGYQDGLQQGQAEGRKQGLSEGEGLIREQLSQLQALLEQLQQPLHQVDQQVEQSLLQLALAMAEAVVAVEVKTNPQVVLHTLRQAIDALPQQRGQVKILLNPADLAVITAHYEPSDIAARQWQLAAEPGLQPGDIQVSCGDSIVERTLKQRLQQSLEHFLQQPDISPES